MGDPYLSIAAIVRDEARHIEEWIAFHQLVGVEHFRIYDNGSVDNTVDILCTLPNVDVVSWPGPRQQLVAYGDALEHTDSTWVAFLDADEFLFSPLYLPLPTLLRDYEDRGAVGACWAVYGTSGLAMHHERVITNYRHRAATQNPIHRHVKSIVQPRRTSPQVPRDPHHFVGDTVDEHFRPLDGPFATKPSWDVFRINHYISKSCAEAVEKMRRPRADTGTLREIDLLSDEFNAEQDDAAWPYGALLLARMEAMP